MCRYGLVDSDDEDAPAEGAAPPDDQRPASIDDEGGEPEGEGMLLSASLTCAYLLIATACAMEDSSKKNGNITV